VSWKPDPDAWFYNAFFQPWLGFTPNIFSLFSLYGKVLLKIQCDRVPKAMMIAPCWPTGSAWYPTLLFLLFDHPIKGGLTAYTVMLCATLYYQTRQQAKCHFQRWTL
jgi:hypothetical protein